MASLPSTPAPPLPPALRRPSTDAQPRHSDSIFLKRPPSRQAKPPEEHFLSLSSTTDIHSVAILAQVAEPHDLYTEGQGQGQGG